MPRRRPATRRGGFTLIEVLATMLLLGIVLPVAMRGVSVALSAAGTARHLSEAAVLAEAKLNELATPGASGAAGALIGAAAFMEDEDDDVRATLAALGVFELGVTMMTRTQTAAYEAEHPTTEQIFEKARQISMPQAAARPQPGTAAGSDSRSGVVAM